MWERPRSLGHNGPSHISQTKTPSRTLPAGRFELTKPNETASALRLRNREDPRYSASGLTASFAEWSHFSDLPMRRINRANAPVRIALKPDNWFAPEIRIGRSVDLHVASRAAREKVLQDRSAFISLRYLCGLNCACAWRRPSAAAFDFGSRRSAASNSGMLSRGLPDARRTDPRLVWAGAALLGFNRTAS